MDNRQVFPLLYDLHHSYHLEDIPFWYELARKNPGVILELGCGTGRVTIPLAESGCRMVALDHDIHMLKFLKSKLTLFQKPRPAYLLADMCAFHFSRLFETIILPCNTLSTLTPNQRQAAFQCIANHLKPEGLFSASMPNPNVLHKLPASAASEMEEILFHPLNGNPIQVSSSWKRLKDTFLITWHYDHLFPDGRIERVSKQVLHHLDPISMILSELDLAGLTIIELLGSFDRTPYTLDSKEVIFICTPK